MCNGLPATIVGPVGNDNLYGTAGNDVVDGGAGNDDCTADLGDSRTSCRPDHAPERARRPLGHRCTRQA
jgi:hypothetical protein